METKSTHLFNIRKRQDEISKVHNEENNKKTKFTKLKKDRKLWRELVARVLKGHEKVLRVRPSIDAGLYAMFLY